MFIALRNSTVTALLCSLATLAQQTASPATTSIPRLIRFESSVPSAATASNSAGSGRFSIYNQEFDGTPLWTEAHLVQPGKAGRFSVLLGSTATDGIPAELFQSGEPRWLEVEIDSVKQPRILIGSVPYALHSADADTLGGLPASAFMRMPIVVETSAVNSGSTTNKATHPPGRDNAVPQPLANNCLVLWFNATTCSMVTQDTVSGGQTLTVSGSQGFTNGLLSVQNTNNAGGNNLASLISPNLPIGNETFFNLGVSNTPNNWVSQGFYYGGNGSAQNRYDFQFAFTPQPAFSILAGGNVGFGTITPTQKLEVAGTGKFSGGVMFGDGTVQTTAATSTGGGGGVGTITGVTAGTALTGGGTAGTVTLNVDTTKVPLLNANNVFTGNQTLTGTTVMNGTQGFTNGLFSVQNANAGGNNIASLISPNLPAGNETFFNLGVSNTPNNWVSQGFYYAGNGSAQNRYDFQFAFSPQPAFSILANGNVGFGTITPSQKLHVAGNLQVDGVLLGTGGVSLINTGSGPSSSNTGVGAGAQSSNTTGTQNTSVGSQANGANTTGSDNTGVGAGAHSGNVDGNRNTAIGSHSLFTNVHGSDNTAIGYQAHYNNTTGTQNVAIGGQALQNNTTGSDNAAAGYQALQANTTGNNNSAFGASTLTANTTGVNNTAIGTSALNANVGGGYNTATGYAALGANTSGQYNTANGTWALEFNLTGSNNTATGKSAMLFNSTGSQNVANGVGALAASTGASNNVAVGINAAGGAYVGDGNVAVGSNALSLMNAAGTNTSNTALGANSLANLGTGFGNIAVGQASGTNLTSGHDNIYLWSNGPSSAGAESLTIRIGSSAHTSAYFGGVRGVTTGASNAVPVVIDSNGQLGTVSSSRRFKKDIEDMGEATSDLMRLRPVTYRYKQAYADGTEPLQYGLIAEEVAEIFPGLVAHSADGQIETVKYQDLTPMLLNELQRMYKQNAEQKQTLERQSVEMTRQREQMEELQNRLKAIEAAIARR